MIEIDVALTVLGTVSAASSVAGAAKSGGLGQALGEAASQQITPPGAVNQPGLAPTGLSGLFDQAVENYGGYQDVLGGWNLFTKLTYEACRVGVCKHDGIAWQWDTSTTGWRKCMIGATVDDVYQAQAEAYANASECIREHWSEINAQQGF